MTEGTKIGGSQDEDVFNNAIQTEAVDEKSLKATKIGELSDLEKSLLPEEPQVEAAVSETEKDSTESPVEPVATEEKESVSTNEKTNINQSDAEIVTAVDEAPEDKENPSFSDALDLLIMDYQEGDIIKGVIRTIEKSGIMVDIRYKSDGFLPNNEFSFDDDVVPSDEVKVGDEINVFIEKLETKEGYTTLSRKKAEYEMAWGKMADLSRSKDVVTVKVESQVKGGLVAEYQGIKGFIPASQVIKDGDEDLENFVNQKLSVCVLKADRRRKKVIFSHKVAENKANQADREKMLATLEVGNVKPGVVTSVKDFGVFVDLGGVEGLVHISELSWSRVKHPSDLVMVGDKVKVFVLGVDLETCKISLGMKQLEVDPWVNVSENYKIGQIIEGEITRILNFGAFIKIDDKLEGLIHISELSFEHVERVEDVVKVGDIVSARIIKLIPEEQKIGLTLKGLEEESQSRDNSVATKPATEEVSEEIKTEVAVEESSTPETPETEPEAPAAEPSQEEVKPEVEAVQEEVQSEPEATVPDVQQEETPKEDDPVETETVSKETVEHSVD